jgi:hypothetical protein
MPCSGCLKQALVECLWDTNGRKGLAEWEGNGQSFRSKPEFRPLEIACTSAPGLASGRLYRGMQLRKGLPLPLTAWNQS